MLRFKPLPFVQTIANLVEKGEKDEAIRLQQAASQELLECKGFEFVLKALREVQLYSLAQIATGQRPEYWAGQLAAVENVRGYLGALVPAEKGEAEIEGEELEEAFDFPESGFNIPLPE